MARVRGIDLILNSDTVRKGSVMAEEKISPAVGKKQSNERVEVVSVHYILDGSYQPVKWVVFPLHAFYVLFRTFHVAVSLAQRYEKVNAVSNPKPVFEKRRC